MQLTVRDLGRYIYKVREQRVMIDNDLAEFLEISVKRLNEQVQRNTNDFPDDFMFHLRQDEFDCLKLENSSVGNGRGQYRKFLPLAFTEPGVIVLTNLINSQKARELRTNAARAFILARRSDTKNSNVELVKLAELFLAHRNDLKEILTSHLQFTARAVEHLGQIANSLQRQLPHSTVLETKSSENPNRQIRPKSLLLNNPETLKVEAVKEIVSNYYQVQTKDLITQTRSNKVALARQVAMYLIRKTTQLSFNDIGGYFGARDHTTVMHACKKVVTLSKEDEDLLTSLKAIEALI